MKAPFIFTDCFNKPLEAKYNETRQFKEERLWYGIISTDLEHRFHQRNANVDKGGGLGGVVFDSVLNSSSHIATR